MTNDEIINRCDDWLTDIEEQRPLPVPIEAATLCNVLLNLSKVVLQDMRDLAQMGDAGLGHIAGPQVRRLLEISTVVWDMRTRSDYRRAEKAEVAFSEGKGFSNGQIKKSQGRLAKYLSTNQGDKAAERMWEAWERGNQESHFNLSLRVKPISGPAVVRQGIALGYLAINETAVFVGQYSPLCSNTLGERLDECGLVLLGRA